SLLSDCVRYLLRRVKQKRPVLVHQIVGCWNPGFAASVRPEHLQWPVVGHETNLCTAACMKKMQTTHGRARRVLKVGHYFMQLHVVLQSVRGTRSRVATTRRPASESSRGPSDD